MCENLVKDFQNNLNNFVIASQHLAACVQNLAKIMAAVDPNQQLVSKSVPALIDWSCNLFIQTERFDSDVSLQLAAALDKEVVQPEATIRTMSNIYEKILFFLNHMMHSYIDFSRSESPLSAYDCQSQSQSVTSCVPNATLQRFRAIQQQQQQQYRRWSEAAASVTEPNETNVDSNRRWSMPTNGSKTQSRFIPMMNKLAGFVNHQQSQSTIPEPPDGVEQAIQLLSYRPAPQLITSRPSSSVTQHVQHYFRPQQQRQQQRSSRGELNEILILPRTSDPLYLGRYQIAENIRGESDEY